MHEGDPKALLDYYSNATHEVMNTLNVVLGGHSAPPYHVLPRQDKEFLWASIIEYAGGKEINARILHETWTRHKYKEGWEYGKLLNANRKRHPMLVKWGKLSEKDRAVWEVAMATIQALVDNRVKPK